MEIIIEKLEENIGLSSLAYWPLDTIIDLFEKNTGLLAYIGLSRRYTATYKNSGSEETYTRSFNKIEEMLFEQNNNKFQIKNIVIPAGVTEIPEDCFWAAKIYELVLPAELQKIGLGAFRYFQSTNKLIIPAGVTEISEQCFNSANIIDELVLPAKLQKINEGAFQSFSTTTKLIIPAGVTKIPENCFFKANINKLLILNPNIEISDNAFTGFKGTIYTFGDDFKKFIDAGIDEKNIINLAKVEDASLCMELCGDIPIATLRPIHEEYNIKCWKELLPSIEVKFNGKRHQNTEGGLVLVELLGLTPNEINNSKKMTILEGCDLFFAKETNEGANLENIYNQGKGNNNQKN